MKKVTIRDVARIAGVSISTASNALNGIDLVKPATRDHIKDVAKQMGYVPNFHGKNLKNSSTNIIGLFLTTISGPYYSVLAQAISEECMHQGYELDTFITSNTDRVVENILGKRVDGAVVLNENVTAETVDLFDREEVKVVFLDREEKRRNITSVVFNSYDGGKAVARHLLNLGHRSFAVLRGFSYLYDSNKRLEGFIEEVKNAGLPENRIQIFDGHFEEQYSYDVITSLLKSGYKLPDALFAENDVSAIGCLKALHNLGIKVPQDVSVVGYDDIDICEYFSPKITTVQNPISRQGSVAVRTLVQMIGGAENLKIAKLQGKLVARESSAQRK